MTWANKHILASSGAGLLIVAGAGLFLYLQATAPLERTDNADLPAVAPANRAISSGQQIKWDEEVQIGALPEEPIDTPPPVAPPATLF